MAKKLVSIEGMKCDGCVENVTKAFSALNGVNNVEVSLENKNAIVDGDVAEADLKAALADTHYSVVAVENM
ncbi:heavy-metal-associated domain-containing protein [Agrilactobacillus yilanensis]|uniref:Heavy-metal-associated domain-containing protein n=1 Tax=Agrilactobacillus yilanensis TaxID=2485997 RepID=A0ABW4JB00_9LACO|nr:heavy metal-associated domain-containing protein [Agrilactobacillus yilanensis]